MFQHSLAPSTPLKSSSQPLDGVNRTLTIDQLKPLFIDESPVENPPKIPENEESSMFNQD
jgi:hypothetical protein